MSQSLNDLLQPLASEAAIKQKPVENAKTLYTFHSQQIDKLKNDKTNVSDLKAELLAKEKRLADVEIEFTGPSLIQTATDIHMLTSCAKLEKEIQDLKERISQIESGADVEFDPFIRSISPAHDKRPEVIASNHIFLMRATLCVTQSVGGCGVGVVHPLFEPDNFCFCILKPFQL